MPKGIYKHKPNQGFQKGHKFYEGGEVGWIKKGSKPKNGFKKGVASRLGVAHTLEAREKMRAARYKNPIRHWLGRKRSDMIGENNPNWKGDEVGYFGLHNWINNKLGKPRYCQHCNRKDMKKYVWANISKEYKRETDDWIRLCTSCHIAFDDSVNLGWKRRRERA